MKYNYLILLLTLSLFSCSKYIEGEVRDNFGNPIEGVKVSIENSDFQSFTDPNGNYKLDYVPGEFSVSFNKEDYVSETVGLNITEKQRYPMSKIELIRYPESEGIYIEDSLDYILLEESTFPTSKRQGASLMLFSKITQTLYHFPDSAIQLAAGDGTLEIFQFKAKGYRVIGPNSNGIIALDNQTAIIPQRWPKWEIVKLDDNLYRRDIKIKEGSKIILVKATAGSFLGSKIFTTMNKSGTPVEITNNE